MNIITCFLRPLLPSLAALLLAAAPAAPAQAAAPNPPVKLIFDTDMGNDVDDALALAVIHALQNRGSCELLAVTLTCPEPLAPAYVAAVNTFYGRPGIPIGVNPGSARALHPKQRFLEIMLRKNPDGSPVFPSGWDASAAPRAVDLLRRTLAGADDASIVIVQVGFSTNLAALLDTRPDALSPLGGRDLAARKVRLLSVMAGDFSTGKDGGASERVEFNIKHDIPAARKLAGEWPAPIVWGGFEVGMAVRYPARSMNNDFAYVASHPVREAYQSYLPTPHERPCWDLISTLYAIWPDRPYYGCSPPGRVTVSPEGRTAFVAQPEGRDRYLRVDANRINRLREVLSILASEPPKTK
ncbi:MAG: nucleoside hydrolase [Opitutaceae bacterium]|jgi:inosine-uridine nucleoside N-ribohydrolase|nr:nucleoside hydrolase [Opitutaceae bacterium]